MAISQEQVDAWFAANPNATAEDVAKAVQSIGGLEANQGLAGMIANRYSIAEPEVTNYYNAYTSPKVLTGTDTTTGSTNGPIVDTFTDTILNTPTTQNDLLSTLAAPADNITSTGGITKSAIKPTSGGVSNVIEGDDIATQIAQLPKEYASWSRSADQRTMELIRKSDGAVLDRRAVGDFSDLDLAKIGLSFIPGAGQILAALNVADAARTGNWTQAAIGATGLIPGMQNVNTALRVGQAVDSGNTLGALTALAGNTDLQNVLGLNTASVGGFTAKDAMAAGNLLQAATTGNYAGVITNLGTLAGSSDTALAGRALSIFTRFRNGDTKALGDALALSNSIASSASTTGANTPTSTRIAGLDTGVVSDAGNGYTLTGTDGTALTFPDLTTSSILSDASLFNSGLNTLGTDGTGGNITDTTGLDAGDVITGLDGTTGTGTDGTGTDGTGTDGTDVDDKGTTTIIGTRESCPVGTKLNLATGECDPDWDETGVFCAAGFHDDGSGKCVPDDDKTVNTECAVGQVRDLTTGQCIWPAEDCAKGFHLENGLCVADDDTKKLDCPEGYEPNDDNTECIPVIEIEDKKCQPGYVYDEDLKKCVPKDTGCAPGFHDDGTGLCVPDDEECSDGYHLENGKCVPDECPEGYVRDLETGQCVPADEPCKPGFHKDDTGACVPDEQEPCKAGYHRDASGVCVPNEKEPCKDGYHRNAQGVCVPDDVPCEDGYHLENGICVPDEDPCEEGYHRENGVCVLDDCPDGYLRNLETGLCEKIEDKGCPPGQVKNAEGKCVPIVKPPPPPVNCQPGYEKVNGVCVPVCQPGYVRVNGVCKKITTDTAVPTSALAASGEKTDPIYAGGMDEFNLLATLEQLLSEEPKKKDDNKSKEKTKMASGGHLDDLLAEQMTVDDLLKLLR